MTSIFSGTRFLLACTRAVLLTLALCPILAGAQSLSPGKDTAEQADNPLSQEQLDELINVLDDKETRERFLHRLQTLSKAEQSLDANDPAALSEVLHLDQKIGAVTERYLGTLERFGLQRSTVGKIVIVAVACLIFALIVLANNWFARFLDRKLSSTRSRFHLPSDRFSSLFAIQVWAGLLMAGLLLVYTLSQVYGEALGDMLSQTLLLDIAETVLAALLVILLFLTIWELSNAIMEYLSGRENSLSTARAQTLLPMVRNVLLFVLLLLATMVLLSELGIDVMPLLAGAGVLGIAIGFGAQTLVKDFLTGFTIIAEDLMHVGDVVTVGGRTGQVTRMTIRKIELRALDGTVHTVPFSEIAVVDNLTKDYSYYMLDVGVAYREDTDEVIACLMDIDQELRDSDEFGPRIIEPLEVLGVDQFGDSAVVIKARTRTRAHDKWKVGREFNRRIKYAFDERNIEIPFPHQTIFFGEDKQGRAQAAGVELFQPATKVASEAGSAPED